MKNSKFLYFSLFFLLLTFEVKAQLTFEYHVGVSYGKNISGYNLKLNSNYSMISQIPEYETHIEVSTSF